MTPREWLRERFRREPAWPAERCGVPSCPVCRPWAEGYPGDAAMRWTPDCEALLSDDSWRLPRG